MLLRATNAADVLGVKVGVVVDALKDRLNVLAALKDRLNVLAAKLEQHKSPSPILSELVKLLGNVAPSPAS